MTDWAVLPGTGGPYDVPGTQGRCSAGTAAAHGLTGPLATARDALPTSTEQTATLDGQVGLEGVPEK